MTARDQNYVSSTNSIQKYFIKVCGKFTIHVSVSQSLHGSRAPWAYHTLQVLKSLLKG